MREGGGGRGTPQWTCQIQSGSILVMDSYDHYGQQAERIGPDCICRIQLPTSNLFLARIWSKWPGQVLAKRIWSISKPLCKNDQAWFWQIATGFPLSDLADRNRFPTFRLCCSLPQTAQIILCKTIPDLNWFRLSGFGQMDQQFQANPDIYKLDLECF